MSTILLQKRQPSPTEILVESKPVKDGLKLSQNNLETNQEFISWEDIRGLS